jgi:hypothetical protein
VLPYPYGFRLGLVKGSPRHALDSGFGALFARHFTDRRLSLAERIARSQDDRRIATRFASALWPELERLAPGPEDAIMLPSADLYASTAVLAWLARRPPSRAPTVLLRFLGMLETEGLHRPHRRLKALLRRAAALRQAGYPIILAAEVEPWARQVQERAGGAMPVLTLPTPPDPPSGPMPARDPARIGLSLISVLRDEQGAQRLTSILRSIPAEERRRLDVVAQAPESPEDQAGLDALGLRFAANRMPDTALIETLQQLDLSLLPYQPARYARRGSSMLCEAANVGHCVVASAGCGFSPEIERFGLGPLCVTDEDFAAALTALVRAGNPRAQAATAAQRYNAWRQAQAEQAVDSLERR